MRAGSSGNKHQQRSEATRRKLLKSALRVFARDGFEAARIEDIAAEAGHTRGAFYANFTSKEDLFFALVEQLGKERVERIERLLECCPTPEERLAALREYYVNRMADRQWVMLLVEFKLFALRRGRHRARLAAAFRRARASVKTAALEKLLPERFHVSADRVEAQKAVLEAALNGLVLEHAYDPLRLPESEAASALSRFFDVMTGAQ